MIIKEYSRDSREVSKSSPEEHAKEASHQSLKKTQQSSLFDQDKTLQRLAALYCIQVQSNVKIDQMRLDK